MNVIEQLEAINTMLKPKRTKKIEVTQYDLQCQVPVTIQVLSHNGAMTTTNLKFRAAKQLGLSMWSIYE